MPAKSIYFLSDAHFSAIDSAKEREKRLRFRQFLSSIDDAERLYIVGDLFDFWFEYRRVIPAGFQSVLMPLRERLEAGTGITLVGGNHDYWLGRHLREELGFDLAPEGMIAEHQGRRLMLDHGDESLSGDRGYLALKKIIRNRLFIGMARLLHPDITFWAADKLSHGSRWLDDQGESRARPMRPLRLKKLLDDRFDALILGHLHMGFHYQYRAWEILCLGDWIVRFSYARLQGGQFSLMDDRDNSFPAVTIDDPDLPPRCQIRKDPG